MAFREFQTYVAVHLGQPARRLADRLEILLERDRERLGLWAPVMLGAGVCAWFWLDSPAAWLGWTGLWCALAVSALLLPAGGREQRAMVIGALLAAAGCLLIWGKALATGERPIARATSVELVGRVVETRPLIAEGIMRLSIRPDRADLPRLVRVNLADRDHVPGLGVGARVRVRTRLMPPAPPAVPGAYDFARVAYFAGIGGTGRVLPPLELLSPATRPLGSLRERLGAHVLDRLPRGEGAIAATLATGETGAIAREDADAMRKSGLAHLLSISGLHVSSLIGATIWLIMRVLALSPRIALALPVPAIAAGGGALAGIGYTLLTGAQVPTVRSCVAALLVLAGIAIGRQAISLRLVATGALIVLLLWPEALVGPSFQMSFLAVTVIVALAESRRFRALTHAREEGFLRRFARAVLALFLVGLAIEAALMPVALYHFHQTGVLGALANLVAIPLTTFVVMPFEALALLLDLVGAGAPAWWVAGKALALLLWVAHVTAAQTAGLLALPTFGAGPLVLVLGGLLWLFIWRIRQRWWGLLPVVLGTAVMAAAPTPDILVTGDGRHLAVRTDDGRMALLRGRAGDYVRDMLSGAAGEGRYGEPAMAALPDLAEARCSRDLCAANLTRAGRRWRILATRSDMRVPWSAFIADCAAADIVVSDRRLPKACHPRWLRLDRTELAREGGAAIYLRDARVVRVHGPRDRHPWIKSPEAGSGRPAASTPVLSGANHAGQSRDPR